MKRPMQFILAIVLLCTARLFPQEAADTLSNEGKKALTFSIDGFVLGGGLGGTFWVDNHHAIRVLFSGQYRRSRNLTDQTNESRLDVSGTVYLDRHFAFDRGLSPYVGVGGGLQYTYYEGTYYTQPSRYLYVTLPVLLGVEYWITDVISLSGEQYIKLRFGVGRTSRELSAITSTSSLLLSVYF